MWYNLDMKMTYPKVKIVSGIDIDSQAYFDNLSDLKDVFFREKLYLILPYLSKQKYIAGKTVYLPKLYGEKSPSLSLSKNEIMEGLKKHKVDNGIYENYFKDNFKNFWSDLSSIIPITSLLKVGSIVVEVSNVGSGGRCFTESYGKGVLGLRIRSDMPLNQLFSLILMGVLNINGFNSNFTWEEMTALRDWLMESSVLSKYFIKDFSMLKGLRKNIQQGKYFIDSQNYLKEIGIVSDINVVDTKVNINGQTLTLGDKEGKILSLLIANKGKVVSYDDIFKGVWGENVDKFSLYSISKLVERVRKKLLKGKINNLVIQAYKGKGYYAKL